MTRRARWMIAEAALTLVLLAAGGVAAWWFLATEQPASAAQQEEVARVVTVETVRRADRPVRVRAMGTIRPALEATLRPRVSGTVVEQHEDFVPGGFFAEGTTMLRIDRADYEQTLRQREAEVARAEAALEIERGDQAVAREELELLEADIPEINRDLILRIPQVNQAEADLRAAEAAVASARLELQRTAIRAPFDGHVVDRAVTLGNNVDPGTTLATFVGAGEYWVELAVPVASLRWIEAPLPGSAARGAPDRGSRAVVQHPRVWGEGVHREGRVRQIVGSLEAGSRLARVLVAVPDPLALDRADDAPALLLGAFVEVEIVGRTLDDCVVVDRELIREGDTVWIMGADDRLETRTIDVAFRGRRHAWVVGGLADGDRVIATNLQTPVEGMLLRRPESDDGTRGSDG